MSLFPFLHRPRFTEKQWLQLKPGMSEEEVTAILGCPSGDYTGGKGMYLFFIDDCPVSFVRSHYEKSWCGHHGAIGLVFDNEGKLRRADYFPVLDPPPTFWEKLKGWLSFEMFR